MKNNQKAYSISIYDSKNIAFLVCITYDVGYTGNHRAGEFYQLVGNLNFLNRSRSKENPVNFCEELLSFNNAAEIIINVNEPEWIEKLMKECYGTDSKIEIKLMEMENLQK